MSLFIGIDQSLTCTAIVALRDGVVVDTVLLRGSQFTTKYDWIYSFGKVFGISRAIEAAVYELIDRITGDTEPVYIVMEGLSFSSIGRSTRQLGGLFYLTYRYLDDLLQDLTDFDESSKIEVVPPATLKKFATGRGNCKKETMVEALPEDVREYFIMRGFKKTTGLQDAADAYFLAKYKEAQVNE